MIIYITRKKVFNLFMLKIVFYPFILLECLFFNYYDMIINNLIFKLKLYYLDFVDFQTILR